MRFTFCFSRSCTPYSESFDAPLAVLAGRVRAALDGALVRVAAVALEVQLQVFAAAEPADAFAVTSHVCLS